MAIAVLPGWLAQGGNGIRAALAALMAFLAAGLFSR